MANERINHATSFFTDVKLTCLVFFGHGAPTKQQQQQSPDLKPYLTPH